MKHSVILPLDEVCHRTGLARATIYRYQKKGQFPHSVRRGLSRVGWREDAVEQFIQECQERNPGDDP
jgi:prophage regulatory protein